MKRVQRLPLLLVVCAAMAVPVACGDDDGTGPRLSDLAGTWTLTRASDCEFDTGVGNWGTLTIEPSGAYTYIVDGEVSDSGTMRVSGNTMTITPSDGPQVSATFTLSGDTLVITSTDDLNCPEVLTLVRD